MKVIKRIKAIITHFPWSGVRGDHKFHLECFDVISRGKELCGWGILHLKFFGWDLLTKSLWRDLNGRVFGKIS